MDEFVNYIIKNLVDSPDAVEVETHVNDQEMIIDVRVASDDVGKIIGKKGKTIQALRTIVSTAGARLGCRVRLELTNESTPPPRSSDRE